MDSVTDSMDLSVSDSRRWQRTGKSGVVQSMGSQELHVTWPLLQQALWVLNLRVLKLVKYFPHCIKKEEGKAKGKDPIRVKTTLSLALSL